MNAKFTRHPLSALFAQFDLSDTEIAALSADIAANGQHVPIVITNGQILDGWNRYRACFLAGVEPITEELPDDRDAWAYVCSVNMLRRSLTPKQKAAVFLLHEEMVNGEGVQNCTPSVREVAETFDISHGTAQNLTKVAREGSKELKAAVLNGEVSISNAAQIAALPADQQPAAIVEDKRPSRKPAPVIVEDDDSLGDFDVIEELEQLQARYDELERKCKSLEAGDAGAELAKQIAMTNGLQSRLNQEITKNAELDKSLRRFGKIMAELRKITEVDDDSKIVNVVKFMKVVPK
jgi:predicted DNA-binding protein YlxM (UPF0122 family)